MQLNVYKRLFLVTLLGVLLLAFQAAQAEPEAPETPAEPQAVNGSYPKWVPAVEISKASYAPNGARLPVVAVAANNTLMVGFLIQTAANEASTDLFYRTSTDNGTNWSPGINNMPLPIHTSAARSTELDITYQGNNAHAVWREGNNQIHYARQAQWASNGSSILANLTGPSDYVNTPRIVSSANNRINVVWAEQYADGTAFIRFRRSLNSGNDNFPVSGQIERPDFVFRPAMVVTGNTIHLVWEEGVISAIVYYIRGTIDEGTGAVTWQPVESSNPAPIPISENSGAFNAKQPSIIQQNSTLHVAYANRVSEQQQNIEYVACAGNCLTIGGWQSSGNISGQFVGVYASDPYDMIPTLGGINSCVMNYFHGILAGTNEQILGTSSCNGWAASAQDMVSPLQNRAINPRLKTHNNWWVYLVYQEIAVIEQGGNTVFLPSQIRFVRNDPALYLPLIRKP